MLNLSIKSSNHIKDNSNFISKQNNLFGHTDIIYKYQNIEPFQVPIKVLFLDIIDYYKGKISQGGIMLKFIKYNKFITDNINKFHDHNNNLLHEAVTDKHLKLAFKNNVNVEHILYILLFFGAEINLLNKCGMPPLMLLLKNFNKDKYNIFKFLLDKGADIFIESKFDRYVKLNNHYTFTKTKKMSYKNIKITDYGDIYRYICYIAANNDNTCDKNVIFKILNLIDNYDIYKKNRDANSIIHSLIKYYENDTNDILEYLIKKHKYKITNDLNADLNTIVHILCTKSFIPGTLEIISKLIKKERTVVNMLNKYGKSLLHISCRYHNNHTTRCLIALLLYFKANPNNSSNLLEIAYDMINKSNKNLLLDIVVNLLNHDYKPLITNKNIFNLICLTLPYIDDNIRLNYLKLLQENDMWFI